MSSNNNNLISLYWCFAILNILSQQDLFHLVGNSVKKREFDSNYVNIPLQWWSHYSHPSFLIPNLNTCQFPVLSVRRSVKSFPEMSFWQGEWRESTRPWTPSAARNDRRWKKKGHHRENGTRAGSCRPHWRQIKRQFICLSENRNGHVSSLLTSQVHCEKKVNASMFPKMGSMEISKHPLIASIWVQILTIVANLLFTLPTEF